MIGEELDAVSIRIAKINKHRAARAVTPRPALHTLSETEIATNIAYANQIVGLGRGIREMMKPWPRSGKKDHVERSAFPVHERARHFIVDDDIFGDPETDVGVKRRRLRYVSTMQLKMIELKRTAAGVLLPVQIKTRASRHRGAEFQRNAECVCYVQRASLLKDFHPLCRQTHIFEVMLRPIEVFFRKNTQAETFARRRGGRFLDHEAVVAHFAKAAQI